MFLFAPVIMLSLTIISCSSTKKIKYFQDIADSGQLKSISSASYLAPKVKVDDILSIIVQTLDPTATQIINVGNGTGQGSPSGSAAVGGQSSSSPLSLPLSPSPSPLGYLVDKDGSVTVPILGKIKVEGYTTSELQGIITDVASKYYKDPTVIVRFANFKISITGEVLRPGVYIMPNEKVGLLDAIAMAGDLTIYGKRENVLLIRENLDGTKTPYRINLKKSDILSSPYYYLRQNDIIYVEPGTGKAAATDASQARYYTLIGSALSVLIVLFTRK